MRLQPSLVIVPIGAVLIALLLFGIFVGASGTNALEAWQILARGAFGSSFAWQNTLQRAAPLMLAALCVALPYRAGLIIIGGEGALVLGGLAAALLPRALPLHDLPGIALYCAAGAAAGAAWIGLAAWLRQWRGVNETIGSLLLAYVAIGLFKHLVEGPMRDPASLNKPATHALADSLRIGGIAGSDVHWGLAVGIVCCIAAAAWLRWMPSGFAVRVVGGNARAAQLVGLPTTRLVLLAAALGGACAGLAGALEIGAVHGAASSSLVSGYGYTGILVAFMARHHPLAIIPVAILFGGFEAAGSMLQRRLGLPDASVLVLQGMAFVLILASEATQGTDWRRFLARLFGIEPLPPRAKVQA